MHDSDERAVTLHAMDYQKWNGDFRGKLADGVANYKRWYLRNSHTISLSDKVYDEVFINNPIIKTAITNNILQEAENKFLGWSSAENIYFVLNGDAILQVIDLPMYKDYANAKINVFKDVLRDIRQKKLHVIVEYKIAKGWFDYEKVLKEKKEFAIKQEEELKKAGRLK